MKKESLRSYLKKCDRTNKVLQDRAFYDIRSILGNANWAMFFFLIGGAQVGKSYSVTEFYVKDFIKNGTPFYWIRLTERQSRQLLNNNAEKLIDPDIRRKYNLDLITSGTNVYAVKRGKPDKNGKRKIIEKKLFARVLALSTFYADKGNGYFDKDYTGWYNIACDEFQPEKGERKTFDIVYAFVRQLENLVRNTKSHLRMFCMANLLEEASDLLCCFNFIPEQFGRYKLKKKRAVIDYIEPSKAYKEMRKGSIADILLPNASEYSNEIKQDYTLVYKGRLKNPLYVVKFSKDKEGWFTIWDNNVIKKWNGEKKTVLAMKPYLDEVYSTDIVNNVILTFDNRGYKYRDLITFKTFQKEMALLKPRGN